MLKNSSTWQIYASHRKHQSWQVKMNQTLQLLASYLRHFWSSPTRPLSSTSRTITIVETAVGTRHKQFRRLWAHKVRITTWTQTLRFKEGATWQSSSRAYWRLALTSASVSVLAPRLTKTLTVGSNRNHKQERHWWSTCTRMLHMPEQLRKTPLETLSSITIVQLPTRWRVSNWTRRSWVSGCTSAASSSSDNTIQEWCANVLRDTIGESMFKKIWIVLEPSYNHETIFCEPHRAAIWN